jgi:DNA-binding response OmpR family regulator
MAEGGASRRGRVALIVDSDESTRLFATQALSSFAPGFHVATARDGREAADWLDSCFPDLLCISADDVFGAELLSKLSGDPRGDRSRVIMIGLNPCTDEAVFSQSIAVAARLPRPLRLSSFLASVRDVSGSM